MKRDWPNWRNENFLSPYELHVTTQLHQIHIPSPRNAVQSEIKTINTVSDHMILLFIYIFRLNIFDFKLIKSTRMNRLLIVISI